MEKVSTIFRRPIVANVLDQHPDLGMDGFRTSNEYGPSDDDPSDDWPSAEELFLGRRSFLISEMGITQISTACAFLHMAIKVCPERLTNISSEKLGHVIKDWSYPNGKPTFSPLGAVIVATIICGLEVVRKEDSRDATISLLPYFEMLS